ncbi:MAG TPA: CDP-alcohol phosphatidyltransferase family protein [Dongiaceae bacterium]
MPSIYQLKPAFQGLLRPLVRVLAGKGVTANQITLLAASLSVLLGIVLAIWPLCRGAWLLLPVLLFVRMALNAIDGMLAREHDMKSPLGAFLNELGDVISDAALYLPFALLPGVSGWVAIYAVIAAILTEFTGVVALQAGATRRYDGPLGKSDRAVVYGAMGLALGLGVAAGLWTSIILVAVLALSLATVVNRLRQALRAQS